MAKKKRISFQPFLRKSERGYTEGFFKVYLRINFNGESNKLSEALFDGRSLHWTEEDIDKWYRGDYTGSYKGEAIELRQSLVFYEGVIRHEYEKDPDLFKLKGLSHIIRYYQQNVLREIQHQIRYYFAVSNEDWDYQAKLSELAMGKDFVKAVALSKSKMTPVTSDLITLYYLLHLYAETNFNHSFDFHLGHTLYAFTIQSGVSHFSAFVDNFLNQNEKQLGFDWLARETGTDREFQQKVLPLLNLFPLEESRADRYKYLFREHVSLYAEKTYQVHYSI